MRGKIKLVSDTYTLEGYINFELAPRYIQAHGEYFTYVGNKGSLAEEDCFTYEKIHPTFVADATLTKIRKPWDTLLEP